MPCISIIRYSSIGIPADKSACLRVIEPCVQIQQSRRIIIHCAGILQFIVKAAIAVGLVLGYFAEIVIPIRKVRKTESKIPLRICRLQEATLRKVLFLKHRKYRQSRYILCYRMPPYLHYCPVHLQCFL